jgi:RNA polymerase sigma factor for flagellar operon FliA
VRSSDLHRPPTDGELAEELGVSVDDLQGMLNQINLVSVVALDELLSPGGEKGERMSLVDTLEDEDAPDPVMSFESEETRQMLASSVNILPERERLVITLYYYEGLTLAEIGSVLGVTESRVCQMHTKAVLELRNKMNAQISD